jgi:hypothetical protein
MNNVTDHRAARLKGNQCYCPDCDEYFTTVRNFDRHLSGGGRPVCRRPEVVGLVQDRHGFWQQPAMETPGVAAGEHEKRAELVKAAS